MPTYSKGAGPPGQRRKVGAPPPPRTATGPPPAPPSPGQQDSRGRTRLCVYVPLALRDRFDRECQELDVDRGMMAEIALTAWLDELDQAAEDPHG